MSRTVTLIQGGGIGLDQEQAARRVVAALGVPVEFDTRLAGLAAIEAGQPPLPQSLFDAVKNTGVALKTKLLHPPAAARKTSTSTSGATWACSPASGRSTTSPACQADSPASTC